MTFPLDPSTIERGQQPLWRRPAGLAILTVALIAVFYLLREHWGHALGLWPYLILLACPLMHLMHGHGNHKHTGHANHGPDAGHTKLEVE